MSDKKLFYKRIKEKRKELGYSLEQISDNTKINVKFLRAIEEGNFKVLPQTYIKLFLKSYAQELNLNVQEILKDFEKYKFSKGIDSPEPEEPAGEEKKVNKLSITPGTNKKNFITILAIIVVFFIVIFTLKRVLDQSTEKKDDTVPLNVSEIPINENGGQEPDTTQPGTAEALPDTITDTVQVEEDVAEDTAENLNEAEEDNQLSLEATFEDSCWINIVMDREDTIDAIYLDNNQIEWNAEENFIMNIGKPKAISSLTLNGRDLGPVGNDVPVILYINRNGIYRRSKME